MGLGLQMIAWDDDFCEALAARGFYVMRFDNRDVGLSTSFDAWGDPNPLHVFDELRKKHPVDAPYLLRDMADDAVGAARRRRRARRARRRRLDGRDDRAGAGDPSSRARADADVDHVDHRRHRRARTLVRDDRRGAGAVSARSPRASSSARSRSRARSTAAASRSTTSAIARLAARSFDRAYHPGGVRRQLIAIWLSGDRTAGAAASCSVPTLVMHGDADPLVPVDGGRATARAIPGARLEIIAGMGHELPRRGLAARHRRRHHAGGGARAVTSALVARAPVRYPCDYIDKGGLAVTDGARGCSGTPTWQLVVRGALDPAHVRTALADVVARYPSLRCTRIHALDGEPLARAPLRLRRGSAVRRRRASFASSRRATIATRSPRWCTTSRIGRLDLFADFPVTLTLARTGDDGCRLFFRQHHAIADGRAFIGLLVDFAAFLDAARAGRRPPPEALAPIHRAASSSRCSG